MSGIMAGLINFDRAKKNCRTAYVRAYNFAEYFRRVGISEIFSVTAFLPLMLIK